MVPFFDFAVPVEALLLEAEAALAPFAVFFPFPVPAVLPPVALVFFPDDFTFAFGLALDLGVVFVFYKVRGDEFTSRFVLLP